MARAESGPASRLPAAGRTRRPGAVHDIWAWWLRRERDDRSDSTRRAPARRVELASSAGCRRHCLTGTYDADPPLCGPPAPGSRRRSGGRQRPAPGAVCLVPCAAQRRDERRGDRCWPGPERDRAQTKPCLAGAGACRPLRPPFLPQEPLSLRPDAELCRADAAAARSDRAVPAGAAVGCRLPGRRVRTQRTPTGAASAW